MAHRRHYSRLPFTSASALTVGTAGHTVETELLDISLKGALVRRPRGVPAQPGEAAVLTMQLPDSDVRITMKGTLSHVSAERLGLHCLSIDVDSITHLRRLLELNFGDPSLLERELFQLG